MTRADERAVELLRELGRRPAAPFFEQEPADYIFGTLSRLGLNPTRDAWGNVAARYRNLASGADQPPIAFVAHMDHPGFEIVDTGREPAVAKALGGVPAASLTQPTPVLVLASDARRVPAETVPLDGGVSRRETGIRLPAGMSMEPPVPVVFDLPDFELDGGTLRMRALDDLAGCAAILAATERLVHEEAEADVFAVFTRAEEVGLYGARLMAEAQTLPMETFVRLHRVEPCHTRRGAGRRAGDTHRRRGLHLRRGRRACPHGRRDSLKHGTPGTGASGSL